MVLNTPYPVNTILMPVDPREKLPPAGTDEVLVQFKHGTEIYKSHKVDTLKANRIKAFIDVIAYWFHPIQIGIDTVEAIVKDVKRTKDAKES